MSVKHKLRKLEKEDLDWVISKAKNHLPESLPVYGWLQMQKKFGSLKNSPTVAYIPENDIPFFILINKIVRADHQSMSTFWKPGSIDHEDIVDLLKSIPMFNWKEKIFFYGCCSHVLDEIHTIIHRQELSGDSLFQKENCVAYSYVPNLMKMSPIEPSDGVRIDSLQPEDVSHVYDNWDYQASDSREALRSYIEAYPSYGAYVRSTNASGTTEWNLASWIISKRDGQMGITYTYPQFRNRKLASIVTQRLTKELTERQLIPFVFIVVDNIASISFHEKLGFERQAKYGWEIYASKQGM